MNLGGQILAEISENLGGQIGLVLHKVLKAQWKEQLPSVWKVMGLIPVRHACIFFIIIIIFLCTTFAASSVYHECI